MNCQETGRILDAFFDGELDGRLMRDAALHVTRCAACEGEFAARERVQDLLRETVRTELEGTDPGAVWRGVERALEAEAADHAGRRRLLRLRAGRRVGSRAVPSVGARLGSRWPGGAALAAAALAASIALAVLFVGRAPEGGRGLAGAGAVSVSGPARLASGVPAAGGRAGLAGGRLESSRGVSLVASEDRAAARSFASPRPSPLLRRVAAQRGRRQVEIESLDSRARATAMWSAPASDTAVIWIGESATALRGRR